jgi:serine acetyltransferase
MNGIFCDWSANGGRPKEQVALTLFRLAQQVAGWSEPWRWLGWPYLAFYRLTVEWTLGIELRPQTQIGPGLRLFHAQALVVHEGTQIGANVTLRQSTTIGSKRLADGSTSACPQLGDAVEVGANAVIIGAVRIGDGAVVGAGAVVVKDVPPGAVVAGNPARVIRSR